MPFFSTNFASALATSSAAASAHINSFACGGPGARVFRRSFVSGTRSGVSSFPSAEASVLARLREEVSRLID
jgi:hypothetical protein